MIAHVSALSLLSFFEKSTIFSIAKKQILVRPFVPRSHDLLGPTGIAFCPLSPQKPHPKFWLQIPTLGIRIAPELEKIGFKRNTVSRLSVPATPPWLLKHPVIDLSIHSSDKAVTPPEVFKVRFYELCDRFKNFCHIYTDGSKMGHEFWQPCAINAVRQLFGCRVQQASSTRNFTLPCLPWMLSEDLKKNTFSCCHTHIQV